MIIPLSVLDLAPIRPGQTASDSFAASVALAQRAEELGYRRVWYAEHHNIPRIASSATSVLIAHLPHRPLPDPRRRRDARQRRQRAPLHPWLVAVRGPPRGNARAAVCLCVPFRPRCTGGSRGRLPPRVPALGAA